VDDPLPRVAANILRLRAENGMTQDALASAASMDPAEVRRIESAQRDPGVRVVTRIARGLGVPAAALFEGVE
jgi:transcriptional regulator with XRE-family HTH domain